ncbi:T6SS immunity protein Tdi1 domain-containing protein [uncultured Aliiroseovarius sp.]|uniref:T6SS immunity protein Tdi1 domain-containing protein n=1 Tax=uncultured Aliiroseovarius sp. TaxID=1658783 RepID=UPI002639E383|nr:T6SS immunity protein Tdi1 domain-containing protein [uncultured Aliiroseovarius sp.]
MHDHENTIDLIGEHWGWLGVRPKGIVDINQFGNIIFLDLVGQYWRICPEELSCEVIADSKNTFSDLLKTEDFQIDWGMAPLVEQARGKLGPLKPGYVYYLVVPAVFGGEYSASNMQSVPLSELIHLSGDFAYETHDLPDGAQIELKIVD